MQVFDYADASVCLGTCLATMVYHIYTRIRAGSRSRYNAAGRSVQVVEGTAVAEIDARPGSPAVGDPDHRRES